MERENRLKQLPYEDRRSNTHTETREAGEEDAGERSQPNTARTGQAQPDRSALGKFARHSAAGSTPPLGPAALGGDTAVAAPHLPSAPSGTGPTALPPDRSATPPCPRRGKRGLLTSSHLTNLTPFLRVSETQTGLSCRACTPGCAPAICTAWTRSLCPGAEEPREAAAAGGTPGRRKPGREAGRGAGSGQGGGCPGGESERLHWRWPKELARQRPGRAMRRHILYIPLARPLLSHTRTHAGHGAAALPAPLPPSAPRRSSSRPARLGPRGSPAPRAAPAAPRRHLPAATGRLPPSGGTAPPRLLRQPGGRQETQGRGEPPPSAGSTRGAPVPLRNAQQGSEGECPCVSSH